MPRKRRSEADGTTTALARLVPVQKRSRERFEHILASAAEILTEKGSEAFRMSDIVERTGVAFGSLYQYFPDKTAIIGTLAERYNAVGRDCVARDLSVMKSASDLHPRAVPHHRQLLSHVHRRAGDARHLAGDAGRPRAAEAR